MIINELAIRDIAAAKSIQKRNDHHLAQIDLALKIGTTREYISMIENRSHKLSINTVLEITALIDKDFVYKEKDVKPLNELLRLYYRAITKEEGIDQRWNNILNERHKINNSILRYDFEVYTIVDKYNKSKVIDAKDICHLLSIQDLLTLSTKQIAFNYIAIYYHDLQDTANARIYYQKAIELDGTSLACANACCNLVMIMAHSNRYKRSFDHLAIAKKIYQKNKLYKLNDKCDFYIANVFLNARDYDEAIDLYRDLLKRDIDHKLFALCENNLLLCLIKTKRFDEARSFIDNAADDAIYIDLILLFSYMTKDRELFGKWYPIYRSKDTNTELENGLAELYRFDLENMSANTIINRADELLALCKSEEFEDERETILKIKHDAILKSLR